MIIDIYPFNLKRVFFTQKTENDIYFQKLKLFSLFRIATICNSKQIETLDTGFWKMDVFIIFFTGHFSKTFYFNIMLIMKFWTIEKTQNFEVPYTCIYIYMCRNYARN